MSAEKVSPGQKLSTSPLHRADVINDVLEATEDFKRRQLGEAAPPPNGAGWPLKVRNLTGGNRLRGEVVRLGDKLLGELNPRNLWFEGRTPVNPAAERYAILADPLPAGEIGPIHISGACVAQVNVIDASHQYAWVAAAGDHTLTSGHAGYPIRYKPDGGGVLPCIVALSEERFVRLAETVGDPEADGWYPKRGRKFRIRFVDAAYAETTGSAAAGVIPRSAEASGWTYNLAGAHIPKGALIWVFPYFGQWWTYWGGRAQESSSSPPSIGSPSIGSPSIGSPSGGSPSGGSEESAPPSGGSPSASGQSSGGSETSAPPSSGSPSRSQSEKSTAIVPASWSRSGYAALFVAEMPEVRFDDVLAARLPRRDATLPIDPRFVEVCEAESIRVCGWACDLPIRVGLAVRAGREVRVRFARQRDEEVELTIRLTGVRKGFADKRFPDRTREQFEANERFIRGAYPGGSP